MQLAHAPSTASTFALNWDSTPLTGSYPFAPALRNFTVDAPDGRSPSLADLRSLRYHHHTRVAVDGSGRVWVVYSGNLTGEDQSGEITEVSSSADGWRTSTGPIVAVAPQSSFTTATFPGMRISYPRAFVLYKRDLYLVAAIDAKAGPGDTQTGLALIAVRCRPDGTLSAPFLVSPASGYRPLPGRPTYPYNSMLGPALFTDANNLGVWGGSQVGYPRSPWTGFTTENNTPHGAGDFVEPSTAYLSSNRMRLYRLWRCTSGFDVFWLYASQSFDGGSSWSPLIRTDIPNAPSSTAMIRLTDGRIALVGNPRSTPGGVPRDPLYLALFNGSSGAIEHVYAVRQGLSGRPVFPNGQRGGAQYPGVWQSGNTLWISYSIAKQQIGVSSAALPPI